MIAALNLLAVMVKAQKPLSELSGFMTVLPQTQVNVPVARRRELSELASVLARIKKVEKALAGRGRVLVRASGTESKYRVLVESPDAGKNAAYADEIASELKRLLA
jgi:phosphoglucosamine mutase